MDTSRLPTASPILTKGPWTKEEDDALRRCVEIHGQQNWSQIARDLGGRVGKQCRERWYNNLSPNIRRDAWSLEEDIEIWKKQRTLGNRWVEIARGMEGRTANAIKNHWNSKLQKYELRVNETTGKEEFVLRESFTHHNRHARAAPAPTTGGAAPSAPSASLGAFSPKATRRRKTGFKNSAHSLQRRTAGMGSKGVSREDLFGDLNPLAQRAPSPRAPYSHLAGGSHPPAPQHGPQSSSGLLPPNLSLPFPGPAASGDSHPRDPANAFGAFHSFPRGSQRAPPGPFEGGSARVVRVPSQLEQMPDAYVEHPDSRQRMIASAHFLSAPSAWGMLDDPSQNPLPEATTDYYHDPTFSGPAPLRPRTAPVRRRGDVGAGRPLETHDLLSPAAHLAHDDDHDFDKGMSLMDVDAGMLRISHDLARADINGEMGGFGAEFSMDDLYPADPDAGLFSDL